MATFINGSAVACPKPLVPDSERAKFPTTYSLEYSPNGQCFIGPTPTANLSFGVYNALLSGLTVGGVPQGTGVSLELTGEGFISFPSSTCTFQLQEDDVVIHRPLVSVTDTISACYFFFDNSTSDDDATGRRLQTVTQTARTWQVDANLNGLHRDPTLFGSPTFTEYNLFEIKLSSLEPATGPTSEAAVLTVHGNGFKVLGEGLLVCHLTSDTGETLQARVDKAPLRLARPAAPRWPPPISASRNYFTV